MMPLTSLSQFLRNFDRFYICIDAIDECNEKHKLSFLRLLSTISTDFKDSARIFITGRSHMKSMVEKAFRTAPSALTLKAKEEDIRKYILSQLEMDRNYDDMDTAFKKDIMDKIVETADGMLVTAPCLDVLTVIGHILIFIFAGSFCPLFKSRPS